MFGSFNLNNGRHSGRATSLTMVLDKGLGMVALQDLLETGGNYIDIIKFGWGTSLVISSEVLRRKIELIKGQGIRVCPGGTLFEIAYATGKLDEFTNDIQELGFNCVEVSDGTIDIPPAEKNKAIQKLTAAGLTVVSEIGRKSKDEDLRLGVKERKEQALGELEAGSWKVIIEAQEGGTCGIFNGNGEVRAEFAEELVDELGLERTIFEAPRKEQQVWLMRTFGSGVNIGNVRPEDVLSLETLRRGLRGDTLRQFLLEPVVVQIELGVPGAVKAAERGDVVVVIDSLRASSTIITALATGIKAVVPTTFVEECKGKLSAGERGGVKIPGLTHGNSPLELLEHNYEGEILYLTTTNGTECIKAAAEGETVVLIGTLLNASAVAKTAYDLARKAGKNITLLTAGRNNLEAPEDTISATEIAFYLRHCSLRGHVKPLYTEDYVSSFLMTDSGKNLVKLGYRRDVEFCSRKDIYDIVPRYDKQSGGIVLDNSVGVTSRGSK